MKKTLIIIAIVLVVIFAMIATLLYLQKSLIGGKSIRVKDNSVLMVDLSNNYPEKGGYDFTGFKFKRKESFLSLIKGIELAADDENIVAMAIKPSGHSFGFAHRDEVVRAIMKFKESGKPVYAYFNNAGMGGYSLVALADHVYMTPSGEVILLGMSISPMFFAGTAEKIGVGWDVIQIGDYKGASEMFVNKEFSELYRETLVRLLDGLYYGWVDDVAERRGLERDSVLTMVDYGVFYGDEALEWGLVDSLLYPQEFDEMIDRMVDEDDDRIIGPATYAHKRNALDGDEKIAVIYGLGSIHTGKSEMPNPFGGNETIGSKTFSKAIDDAAEDDDIEAIVLRIDSPGGSALASDIIWKSIIQAKKKKPVIVSMGGIAASGGYYISMGADSIFCDPNTITGSIGVVFMKAYFDGLLDWAGITIDSINRGALSNEFALYKGMDPEGYEAFNRMINKVYDDFAGKAGEGRDISPDSMEYLAQGRIWLGSDAVDVGLADRVAGLSEVIDVAAKMAKVDPEELGIQVFPPEKSFFEIAFEVTAPRIKSPLPEQINEALYPAYEAATLFEPGEPLTIMPYRIKTN